jgi:hypothetical protein
MKDFFKKLGVIFLLGFFLNLVWEILHSGLYVSYRGEPITFFILFHAALFDALFITALGALFLKIPSFRARPWLAFVIGVPAAVLLELFALHTGRWQYTSAMPLIPFIGTGLTPTIQLGLLSYIIFKLVRLIDGRDTSKMS